MAMGRRDRRKIDGVNSPTSTGSGSTSSNSGSDGNSDDEGDRWKSDGVRKLKRIAV